MWGRRWGHRWGHMRSERGRGRSNLRSVSRTALVVVVLLVVLAIPTTALGASVSIEPNAEGAELRVHGVKCVRTEGPGTAGIWTSTATPTGTIGIELNGAGTSFYGSINPCEGRRRINGHRWHAALFGEDEAEEPAGFDLTVLNGRTETHRFTYKVWVEPANLLGRGTITTRATYYPARLIWEGQDAFVNYCIDEGKRVESFHGRLFCHGPSLTNIRTTVRRERL